MRHSKSEYKRVCLCVCKDVFLEENMQSRNEAFCFYGSYLSATQSPSSVENGLNMTCVFNVFKLIMMKAC